MTESIYQVLENGTIQRTDADGSIWFIPAEPANSSYAAFDINIYYCIAAFYFSIS